MPEDQNSQELLNWQLFSALERDDPESAVQALAAGANPDMNLAGETALHIAVERGYKELVVSLLKHGANPSPKTRFYDQTPLHIAADRGDCDTASCLIDAAADMEARTNGGWTPFHVAVERGHLRIARLLAERGANINARNNAGESGLHFVKDADMNLYAWLADQVNSIDETDETGATPLIYAAAYGRTDIAGILLRKGASPNHRDCEGKTPAELASQCGFPQTADLITTFQAWVHDAVSVELHNNLYQGACNLLMPYLAFGEGRPVSSQEDRLAVERGCEMLKRAFSLNPLNWNAMWILGFAFRAVNQSELALGAFAVAYGIERLNPDVGREFASECIRLGRAEEATRICSEVLELQPFDAGLIANYGLALLISGKIEEAANAVNASRSFSPDDPITRKLANLVDGVRAGRYPVPDRWPPLADTSAGVT